MSAANDNDVVERVRSALESSFPTSTEKELSNYAAKLVSRRSIALAVQHIENSNTPPDKDKEKLEKAAKHMSVVVECLSDVGWHGQKQFAEVLAHVFGKYDADAHLDTASNKHTKERLLLRFGQITDALKGAAANVDLDGRSPNTAFGDGDEFEEFRTGKEKKVAGELLAQDCAKVYFHITRKKPTVPTRLVHSGAEASRTGSEAYGPFLEMVTAVFDAFGETSSPETWAKAARHHFKDFDGDFSDKAP